MSKFFLPLVILVLTTSILLFPKYIKNSFSPLSDNDQINTKLKSCLSSNNIPATDINIDLNNKIISFIIIVDQEPIDVIFSTQKDIYLQTNALQKLLKTVRINHTHLKKVDLSLSKPYATIQNY